MRRFSRLRGRCARPEPSRIGGELVVVKKGSNGADPMFRPTRRARSRRPESVFLGLADEAGRFGIARSEATKG